MLIPTLLLSIQILGFFRPWRAETMGKMRGHMADVEMVLVLGFFPGALSKDILNNAWTKT